MLWPSDDADADHHHHHHLGWSLARTERASHCPGPLQNDYCLAVATKYSASGVVFSSADLN